MTHAAPVSRGMSSKSGTTASTADFGPGVHRASKWAPPLMLGLVQGYWTAANRRGGGPGTGWNLLFGFVTALAFMALYVAVRALAPRLRRELHALLRAGFAGAAVGFLVSRTGPAWGRSAGLGLAVAVVFFPMLFYRFHTREDTEGHRVG